MRIMSFCLMLVCLFVVVTACNASQTADFNIDGLVDISDMSFVAQHWLDSTAQRQNAELVDLDSSQVVNFKDFALAAQQYRSFDPHLLGWWKFNETQGSTVFDQTNNSNDGMFVNGPTRTQWVLDGAVSFDGDDDHIEIANESEFDISGPLTISLWMKVKFFFTSNQALISKGTAFMIFRNNDTNALGFYADGLGAPLITLKNINDGYWHHIAVTYDGTVKKFYIDSQLEGSMNSSGTIVTNDLPVWIGGDSSGLFPSFNGQIDDVRIYSRALDQVQVIELMNEYLAQPVNLTPYDTADYQPQNIDLSWTPGTTAGSYDIYFGNSLQEIKAADRNSFLYQGNFTPDANSLDLGQLTNGQSYYWRIDPVK